MLHPRADDGEVFGHALAAARNVRAVLGSVGRSYISPTSAEEVTAALNYVAVRWQARPVGARVGLAGRTARMLDPQWWARNVRRELLTENEGMEHAQCVVRRKGQVYCSDHAFKRKAQRAKRNRETLARLEVQNDEGQALNLLEVSDASVSNPKLRRAELMVRCRGFEETAKFYGHEAVFLTLTAPSRFHRFSPSGQPNPKWAGETPKDAQKYLTEVWARIRAAWNRRGIVPYGFRVAEPHHDGCPHWHILLFCPPGLVGWYEPTRAVSRGRLSHHQGAGLVGIAGKYALADSPMEPGAMDHRFTYKLIDPSKGSATGYIAKYIAKNVDGIGETGDGVGMDFASGKTAQDASARVRVWASTWGIRQFQQIGGPSVTVWRELRKLAEGTVQNDLFEAPRAAADRSLWALFWVLQGGPDAGRVALLKPQWDDSTTGRYGDAVRRVVGVTDADKVQACQTRLTEWRVQRAGLGLIEEFEADRLHRRDMGRRYPEMQRLGVFDPVPVPEFEGAERPWTGVNNCTAFLKKGPAGAPELQAEAIKVAKAEQAQLDRQNFAGPWWATSKENHGSNHSGHPGHRTG